MIQMAKNDVAVKEEPKLPATLSAFEQFAGGGFDEMRAEDVAIPFIRILAQLSPEVNKRDGKYINGAEAGMLLNTVQNRAYDGEKGILVIPCYYAPRYIEWKPRNSGGGFVASYTPEEAARFKTTRNDRNEDILPNGNLLVNTAQFFVLFLHDEGVQRALISMSSTQLKKGRKWNAQMGALTGKGKNGTFTLPMFSSVYRLKTVAEANDKGDWFGWEISRERALDPANPEDADLVQQAVAFMQSVKAGDVKVKHEDALDTTPSGGSHAGDDNIPF
jgi:hypothetical protein